MPVTYSGTFHELFPSWKEFWQRPDKDTLPEVAPPAPLEQFRSPCAVVPRPKMRVRWSAAAHPRICKRAKPHEHIAFEPLQLGDLRLANRVVMAPMTRNRADADVGVPTALMAEYYGQRGDAGLIVVEGAWPSGGLAVPPPAGHCHARAHRGLAPRDGRRGGVVTRRKSCMAAALAATISSPRGLRPWRPGVAGGCGRSGRQRRDAAHDNAR